MAVNASCCYRTSSCGTRLPSSFNIFFDYGTQQVNEQDQVVRLAPTSDNYSPADAQNSAAAATDPFVWWAATSPKTSEKTPGTFARNATKRPTNYNANNRRKASVRERRQVVVGLLTGTAVVGILGIGGISFARFIESTKQLQAGNTQTSLSNNTSNTSNSSPTQGTTPAATHGTQQTPTVSKTPKAQPSPTKGTQPTPQTTPELLKRHNQLRNQLNRHLRLLQHRHSILEQ